MKIKTLTFVASLLMTVTGCMVVEVKPEHEARIRRYQKEGKFKEAKKELGKTVGMGATVCWGFIPGANHIHMARKIQQSPYASQFDKDYRSLSSGLFSIGALCSFFSVIPYVYNFTMPCQVGGTPVDVIRINNLAYMYHIDAKEQSSQK